MPIEGIFSHIADHEDPAFTNEQEQVFEACIEPLRLLLEHTLYMLLSNAQICLTSLNLRTLNNILLD